MHQPLANQFLSHCRVYGSRNESLPIQIQHHKEKLPTVAAVLVLAMLCENSPSLYFVTTIYMCVCVCGGGGWGGGANTPNGRGEITYDYTRKTFNWITALFCFVWSTFLENKVIIV